MNWCSVSRLLISDRANEFAVTNSVPLMVGISVGVEECPLTLLLNFSKEIFDQKGRVDRYPVVVFRFITVTKPRGRGFDRSRQWCVTFMPCDN